MTISFLFDPSGDSARSVYGSDCNDVFATSEMFCDFHVTRYLLSWSSRGRVITSHLEMI